MAVWPFYFVFHVLSQYFALYLFWMFFGLLCCLLVEVGIGSDDARCISVINVRKIQLPFCVFFHLKRNATTITISHVTSS